MASSRTIKNRYILVGLVASVINKYDPMGLLTESPLSSGAPLDEYSGEADSLLELIRSTDDAGHLSRCIFQLFFQQFGMVGIVWKDAILLSKDLLLLKKRTHRLFENIGPSRKIK
jgi:hypothetical protein